MELDEYQEKAMETAVYRKGISAIAPTGALYELMAKSYVCNGLASEAGEVAGFFKKLLRGDYLNVPDYKLEPVVLQELGGVLWYLAACAKEFGFSLEQVASYNLAELQHRANEGSIANKEKRSEYNPMNADAPEVGY